MYRKKIVFCLLMVATVGSLLAPSASLAENGEIFAQNRPFDQRQQIEAIEARYRKDLLRLEQSLRDQSKKLAAAMANGNTTLAEADSLRKEMTRLEGAYRKLQDQLRQEINQETGIADTFYSHHDHRTDDTGDHHEYGKGGNRLAPPTTVCDIIGLNSGRIRQKIRLIRT